MPSGDQAREQRNQNSRLLQLRQHEVFELAGLLSRRSTRAYHRGQQRDQERRAVHWTRTDKRISDSKTERTGASLVFAIACKRQ